MKLEVDAKTTQHYTGRSFLGTGPMGGYADWRRVGLAACSLLANLSVARAQPAVITQLPTQDAPTLSYDVVIASCIKQPKSELFGQAPLQVRLATAAHTVGEA